MTDRDIDVDEEREQRAYHRERFMYRAGYQDDLADERYEEEEE